MKTMSTQQAWDIHLVRFKAGCFTEPSPTELKYILTP